MASTYAELKTQIDANAGNAAALPAYRCHKEVWALKIREIVLQEKPTIAELEALLAEDPNTPGPGGIIVPEESGFGPIAVNLHFLQKHQPKVGGYLVFYADGYKSFSPAKAFEEGYTRI